MREVNPIQEHAGWGESLRVRSLWQDHSSRVLGTEFRLPSKLLLQLIHKQVIMRFLNSAFQSKWLDCYVQEQNIYYMYSDPHKGD